MIRDGLPKIWASKGIRASLKVLDVNAYRIALKKKLLEEGEEVCQTRTKEELAEELGDVLEVISALCETYDLSFECIEEARLKKKEQRGGFQDRVYCQTVEMEITEKTRPHYDYFRAHPDKYPEGK